MDTILSIFIYMNVVTSPGTYTTTQIGNYEEIYSLTVTTIKGNPEVLNMVISEYEMETASITVIDDGGLR